MTTPTTVLRRSRAVGSASKVATLPSKSMRLFDRLWPRKKLGITAEFNGILPKEARKKALVARDQFDLTEAEQYLTDEFAAKSA